MGIEKIKELAKILKEKDNFLVITHIGYDADALSSLIALGLILKELNKNFAIYLDEDLKEEHSWVPLKEKIVKEIKDNYQNVILVDCESFQRTPEKIHNFIQNKFKIVIDHHQTNKFYGDFNLVLSEKIATAQIIFYLTRELNIHSSEMATLILLGIMGDSLNLTIEFEKEKLIEVLEIILQLVKWGADFNLVNQTLLLRPFDEFKKIAEIFLRVNRENNIFWVVVEGGEVKNSIVSNNLIKIKEAKIIIVIENFKEHLKIHFRSKGNIDVSKLAQQYFNGGGHKNASGGKLNMKLEEGIRYTLEKTKEFLDVNKKF